ncbi:MAG: cell division ATP-binding protein FtsE [Clostridia bacterium]|nr:cell division ATP-binding protein FtsE [Clostridia bacterium]
MIQFENVTKIYDGETTALEHVSFHIEEGEFAFVIGPSGAGKSTVTKLITREELPTEGKIYVNGIDVAKLRRSKVPYLRRNIGMVFQDFRLLSQKTIKENIEFAMEIVGASPREIKRTIPRLLNMIGLANRAGAYPDQLSGGEQQRVALARALANQPPVLIADEPTGNLDPKSSGEIIQLLNEINKQGTTVLVVTHDREIVNSLKKRVITISDGQIFSDEEKGEYHEAPVVSLSN